MSATQNYGYSVVKLPNRFGWFLASGNGNIQINNRTIENSSVVKQLAMLFASR